MNKSNKLVAWLMAGAAAVGAAVGGGYYASRTDEPPAQTASAPAAPTAEPAKPAEPAAGAQAPDTADAAAQGDMPTFSVLRVEKDGSAVVAGSAKPDTKIDLVAGGEVIASTQAGPTGDFAIVLDNPLAPGAHELSLRATDPSGAAVTSQETGIVNVPQGDGELVAMVTRPGEASRVMQAGDQAVETVIAAVEAEVKAEQQAAPAAEATAAAPATAETPATAPAESAAPAAETVKPVLVSAVDFEDGRIYVAGTGEPGRTVNIYIDDAMTGSTVVSPDGAFLLEAPFDLKPGEHKIRADLLSADGTQVAARAEVPLMHEAPVEVAAAETKPAEAVVEPAPEAPAAATEATAPAPAEAEPAEAAAAVTQTETAAPEAPASAEVPMTAEVPAAPAAGEAVAAATEAPAAGEAPAVAADAPAASTEPAAAVEAAPAELPATETAAATQAAEQVEPIKTGASVIIRRGDNLWRISRRMLGARHPVYHDLRSQSRPDQAILQPDLSGPGVSTSRRDHRQGIRGQSLHRTGLRPVSSYHTDALTFIGHTPIKEAHAHDKPIRRNATRVADGASDQLAIQLKALGHPARSRSMRQLRDRDRCCCGDFCATLPLAQSTVSQHLERSAKGRACRIPAGRHALALPPEPPVLCGACPVLSAPSPRNNESPAMRKIKIDDAAPAVAPVKAGGVMKVSGDRDDTFPPCAACGPICGRPAAPT
jgi:nucleoid-associated protein YgaU